MQRYNMGNSLFMVVSIVQSLLLRPAKRIFTCMVRSTVTLLPRKPKCPEGHNQKTADGMSRTDWLVERGKNDGVSGPYRASGQGISPGVSKTNLGYLNNVFLSYTI